MIEGILLTAASFDKQIQFENVVQTEWNGFNFSEPLPIPVGPNRYAVSSKIRKALCKQFSLQVRFFYSMIVIVTK